MDSTLRELLQNSLEPLFRKYSVDLVLTGHVHATERTCGITRDGRCAARDEDGTVYIVAGGAGNDYVLGWDTREFAGHKLAPSWSVFRSLDHGLMEMTVSGDRLELIFVSSVRGEVHDRLVLTK